MQNKKNIFSVDYIASPVKKSFSLSRFNQPELIKGTNRFM